MAYHPFRHLGLKALSVVIAILLWLSVAGEQVVERSILVPLELVNVPAGHELVVNPPPTVSVRIRGSSSVLSQLDQGAVVAVLNAEAARPRRQFFGHLTPADVRAPFGVEVLQVSPGMVPLQLDETLTKSIKVRVPIEGRPADGSEVAAVTVTPPAVVVEGPASSVKPLNEAVTEAIDVSGLSAGVAETVTVRVDDPMVRLRAPQSARVAIEIRPVPITRLLSGVRVEARNGKSRLAPGITPGTVSVEVRGQPATLGAMTTESVAAFADLAGLGPGRYNLPVRVDLPPEVEIVRVQPALVSIRIR